MSTIQTYWRKKAKGKMKYPVIDPVVCRDGFTMSVQASSVHYSIPRFKTLTTGKYERWEVMPLSRPLPRVLAKYKTEREGLTVGTVCGFVPTEVVDAIIAKHGGLEG